MADHAIIPAASPDHIHYARALFREYAESLNFSLCFQGFDEELATLPGKYAPPRGRLFLAVPAAQPDGTPVGCIALRPLPGHDPLVYCEMKRLYIRPAARRHGLGRALCERLIADARAIGYRAMRLDSSRDWTPAITLYQGLGFRFIERYNNDPIEDTVWMERAL